MRFWFRAIITILTGRFEPKIDCLTDVLHGLDVCLTVGYTARKFRHFRHKYFISLIPKDNYFVFGLISIFHKSYFRRIALTCRT